MKKVVFIFTFLVKVDTDPHPAKLCRSDRILIPITAKILKLQYFVNICRWSNCKGWSILTLQFRPRIPAQAISWSPSRSTQVRPADSDPHNLSGSDLYVSGSFLHSWIRIRIQGPPLNPDPQHCF
jgi:hypothetical protein